MKNNILLALITFLISFQFATAQERSCGSTDYLEQQKLEDPLRAKNLENIERFTQEWIESHQNQQADMSIITIPVVVHVVYKTAVQNISTSQIESQITVLNEDFRRLNANANNNWAQAADIEIEFCLASVDPNGNATNGITRTSTNSNVFTDDDKVKFTNQGGHDIWNRNDYLNVWVCALDGFLGYAQFPGGPAATDGVVCDYRYFGTNGTAAAPFDGGRTATHEVGHWLNLYHIWGDGNCNQDDQVADTPGSDAPNYGCPSGHTSCGSVDMIENYMDYTDDGCMNLFTQGQKDRMRALFVSGGVRASLLNSGGCGNGTPPCNTPAGLAVGNVSNAAGTVSWSASSNANSYNLQFRASGSNSWTTQSVNGTSYNLTGLTTCTNYEVRVAADCGSSNTSSYSSTVSFTTGGCPTPCNTPAGLAVTNAGAASWNASANATAYNVQIRQSGSNNWITQSTNSTSYSFGGLSTCTTYEVRVQADCGSGNTSSYSSIKSFTTTGCPSGCQFNEVTLTIIPDDYGNETTWDVTNANGTVLYSGGPYQNGNSTPIVVDLCLQDGCYDFTIYDEYGDGICCAYGNGSYAIEDASGNVLANGGQFGSQETKVLDVNGSCGGGGTPTGDAGVTAINQPKSNQCGSTFAPKVKIKNFDTAPLTSVDIVYDVDGGTAQTFAWTGNLGSGSVKTVTLPAISTTVGSHAFNAHTANPNGGADANPANDDKAKSFNITGDEELKIQIKPDAWGEDITWELLDDNGNILASGGPYANNNTTTKTTKVCVADGCFTFNIYDSYGDGICCAYGNGWYRIKNAANQVIVSGNGQYGASETQNFCLGNGNTRLISTETEVKIPTEFEVFPNPASSQVTVKVANAKPDSFIRIFNTLGQEIRQIPVNEYETKAIDLSNLENGLYLVRLDDGVKAMTKKLTVMNR